jgi:hypothetical protein
LNTRSIILSVGRLSGHWILPSTRPACRAPYVESADAGGEEFDRSIFAAKALGIAGHATISRPAGAPADIERDEEREHEVHAPRRSRSAPAKRRRMIGRLKVTERLLATFTPSKAAIPFPAHKRPFRLARILAE